MPKAQNYGPVVHFTVDRTEDGHVVRNHGVLIAGPFRTAEQAQEWLDRDTERLYAMSPKAKAKARAAAEGRPRPTLDRQASLTLAGVAGILLLLLGLFIGGITLIVIYWQQILVIVIGVWLLSGLLKKWFGI